MFCAFLRACRAVSISSNFSARSTSYLVNLSLDFKSASYSFISFLIRSCVVTLPSALLIASMNLFCKLVI
nr:MAG TPA: hypothetical protein [Caudoviricetes sp.]